MILHGEIGTGKSHALRYLHNYVTQAKAEEFRSPCVYLESTKLAKKTDFLALYRRVMEQIRTHIEQTAEKLDEAIEARVKAAGTPRQQQPAEKQKLWKQFSEQLAPHSPSLILLLEAIQSGKAHAFAVLCASSNHGVEDYQLTGPIDSEFDASRCLSSYINLVTNPDRTILPEETFRRIELSTSSLTRSSYCKTSSLWMYCRLTRVYGI